MGFTNLQKVKCDWEECPHELVHEAINPKDQASRAAVLKLHEDHPWLKTQRMVQTDDGRVLLYCSDSCEIQATGKGVHNPILAPEPPKIISSNVNPAQVRQAAIEAERAKLATNAMKQGSGLSLV